MASTPTPVTPNVAPPGTVPYYGTGGTFLGYEKPLEANPTPATVPGAYNIYNLDTGQQVGQTSNLGTLNTNNPTNNLIATPAPQALAPYGPTTSIQPPIGNVTSSQTPLPSNTTSSSSSGYGAVQGPTTQPPEITQGGSTGGSDSGTSSGNTGAMPSTNSLTGTPSGSAGTPTSGLSTGTGAASASGTGTNLGGTSNSGSASGTGTSSNGTGTSSASPGNAPASSQSFANQLASAIQPNVLDSVYQPTYHFRLFATSDQDILDQAQNKLSNISGMVVNQITIAESGVTGFNIRDVEIQTVAAQNIATGNQTGNHISITIVDPLGISFLDGLNNAMSLLQVNNFTKSIYYLELTFPAYDINGNFVNAAASLPNNGIWIWALIINTIETKLNEGGGVFTLACVALQDVPAFNDSSDYLSIPKQGLVVSGNTVQDIFSDFVTKINAAWLQQYSSSSGPALIALQPIVTSKIILGPPSALGKDPGQFALAPQSPDLSSIRSVEFSSENGVVTCHLTQGTSIGDFIAATIYNTEAGQALLKGEPAVTRKDQTNTQATTQNYRESILFSVEYDIKYTGYDQQHQQYIKQITPRVVEHVTQEAILSPVQVSNMQNPTTQQQAIQSAVNKGMLKKRYDYIFTGNNTEILEYNIDWSMAWQAILPKLDGARMSIDNAEVNALLSPNQKNPQCNLPEAWQTTIKKSLAVNTVLNQTNPVPGTTSASQPQSMLLTTDQTNGGLNWNSISSPAPNMTSAGPASNPVSVSTQEILQGHLNSNDPFFNAMSSSLQIANAANSTPPVAATTQKIASPTIPTAEVQPAANGNNVYIEDVLDRLNQNSTTSVAQLPVPISFWHGYMNTANAVGKGYTGQYHRDKSLGGSVLNQIYGEDAKTLATGKFQILEMVIRGDPFWLGQTNLERQLLIRTKSALANPASLPSYSTDKPLIVFYMQYPVQIGTNFVPILQATKLFNGIYQVTTVVHTFSEGVFKQKITANRQPLFDVSLALTASSTGITNSGAASSPQLAGGGTATSSGGNIPGTTSSGPSLTPTSGGIGQVTPTAIQSNDPTAIGNLTQDQTASLKAAIGQNESNNNPLQGNNGYGYIGQYQFGQSALASTGYVVNGSGAANSPSTWTWTGQNDVNSVSDFLNSPTEQNTAMNGLLTQNYTTMSNNGTISSSTSPQTTAGLLGAAQLAGAGGATNFANGNGNPSDAFGSSTQHYYNLGYNAVGGS